MGCSVSIQPNNYFPSPPSPKPESPANHTTTATQPAAYVHTFKNIDAGGANNFEFQQVIGFRYNPDPESLGNTENYSPVFGRGFFRHSSRKFTLGLVKPTGSPKGSPKQKTLTEDLETTANRTDTHGPQLMSFNAMVAKDPIEEENPVSTDDRETDNKASEPQSKEKVEEISMQDNYYFGSPRVSSRGHNSHRQIKKSENRTPTQILKTIVKTEGDEPERVTSCETPKPRLDKEQLKLQIERKFTVNLLDLVLSAEKSSGRKPNLSGAASHRSYTKSPLSVESARQKESESVLKSPEIKKELPPFDLDVSLDGGSEDEENDTEVKKVNVPYTPIKKSIFGSDFDTSEIMSVRAHGLSHLGVSARGLLPTAEKKHIHPSTSLLDNRRKYSDSSFGSVKETKVLDKTVSEDGLKKINQYLLNKVLGRGSFGKVKMAIDEETGKKYAVKIVNKKKLSKKLLSRDKSMFTQLETEIAVMKKMNHKNIVQLFEVIDDPSAEKLYLVMEYVQRGAVMSHHYWDAERQAPQLNMIRASTEKASSWKHMLGFGRRLSLSKEESEKDSIDEDTKPLPEERARQYFRSLILGLDYMHNYANVIHRDIKPENLLIDEDDNLKISDFNVSCIMETNSLNKGMMKNGVGTKAFLAPEAWLGGNHKGEPLDIWAAGATLYYFLYGRPPFKSARALELKNLIINSEPEFSEDCNVSNGAVELIKACLRKDPNERITLEQIMQDKWLTIYGKEKLSNRGVEKLIVTNEDVSKAFTSKLKTTVMIAVSLKKNLTRVRNSLSQKNNLIDLSVVSSLESFNNIE